MGEFSTIGRRHARTDYCVPLLRKPTCSPTTSSRGVFFERLQEYYTHDAYRFEVPAKKFEAVREMLADGYYELIVVDDLDPYCVVKEAYTLHAAILRLSVVHWSRDGHNVLC